MKSLLVIFSIIVLTSTALTADYITVSPEEYDKIDIPAWMVGPIWIKFQNKNCTYTAAHVLTDPYHKPYVLLSQTDKDTLEFKMLAEKISHIWVGATLEGSIVDRGNDICQTIRLPIYQHWESDNGEANLNSLNFAILSFTQLSGGFTNSSIKIYFKGDLPDWAKQGLPFKIEN